MIYVLNVLFHAAGDKKANIFIRDLAANQGKLPEYIISVNVLLYLREQRNFKYPISFWSYISVKY